MSFSQPAIQNRCRELDIEALPWEKKPQNIAALTNEVLTADYFLAIHKFIRAYEFLLLVIGYRREQIKRRDMAKSITEDEIHSILKSRGLFERKSKQTTNPTEQNPG
jgi:hypothetical protein